MSELPHIPTAIDDALRDCMRCVAAAVRAKARIATAAANGTGAEAMADAQHMLTFASEARSTLRSTISAAISAVGDPEALIAEWQREHGLTADGKPGPRTIDKLRQLSRARSLPDLDDLSMFEWDD